MEMFDSKRSQCSLTTMFCRREGIKQGKQSSLRILKRKAEHYTSTPAIHSQSIP
jgi:hypothetical protein